MFFKRDLSHTVMSLPDIEKQHVLDVYEKIAPHFSSTRYKAWPLVAQFLEKQPEGSWVCDVGCGNGKYFGVNPKTVHVGCDRSTELVKICKNRKLEASVADSLALPFRRQCFDVTISIAVLHHFSTVERRAAALRELVEVTKVGGLVLVTVWAQEQKRFEGVDGDNLMVPWKLQKKYTEGDKGALYERYYHLFKEGELEGVAADSLDNVEIVEQAYDKDNWYVVWRRTK